MLMLLRSWNSRCNGTITMKQLKQNKSFSGKLVNKNGDKSITLRIDILEYGEDGIFYVYCPALELIGYGKSVEEARNSWETVLEEYVSYTVNKNTLAEDLKRHGWITKMNSKKKKEFIPPTFTWIVQNNQQAKDVYNEYEFSKRTTSVNLPCFA